MPGNRMGEDRSSPFDHLGHFGKSGVSLLVQRGLARDTPTGGLVVELGSGIGATSREFRALLDPGKHPSLVGIDLVDRHCAVAAARLGGAGISFVCADAARLPFPT